MSKKLKNHASPALNSAASQPEAKLNSEVVGGTPELVFAKSKLGQGLLQVLSEGSSSYQSIANYLLRNQVRVTALGIEDLAESCQVMGFGLSSHLAGMLALHLQPFCNHVVEVVAYGGTEVAAGHLAQIGEKDILIVISFPRYANDAIRLAQFARDHGTCVIAITDSTASPLAKLGHHLLLAPSNHPVLPSSSISCLAVIEALVASLMASNKKNVEKAIKLTEALSAYLHDDSGLPRPQMKTAAKEGGRAKK
ncbi:MAG: MurR/RpiR family transcriptional regulator [Burkholderiales bacterium]|nr:MurR/RpiR family transcriptional regulator [Burkholderiales bacterium]